MSARANSDARPGTPHDRFPLLLYANSARRIRRAFNYDERDVAAALHNLVDPAKPTVLVLLPQMAWGSTSKEFWTTVCRL